MEKITVIDPAAYAKELAVKAFERAREVQGGRGKKLAADRDGIRQLELALRDFRNGLRGAATGGSVMRHTATVSDRNAAVVSPSGASVDGAFNLHVTELATPTRLTSNEVGTIDTRVGGTLRVQIGEVSAAIDLGTLKEEGGQATVATLALAINSDPALSGKVNAYVQRDAKGITRLIVQSKETGSEQSLSVSVESEGNQGLKSAFDQVQPVKGKDLRYSIDGGEELLSASNAITHLGTTVRLTRENSDVTVTVVSDTSKTRSNLESFAEAYNALYKVLTELTKPGDLLAGKQGGVFQGQSDVTGLRRDMARTLNTVFGGAYLIKTGLELNKDGTLSLDSDRLEATLKASADALDQFFGKAEKAGGGVLARFGEIVAGWVDGDKSVMKRRHQAAEQAQKAFEKQEAALNERLEQTRASLQKRFEEVRALQEKLNSGLAVFDAYFGKSRK